MKLFTRRYRTVTQTKLSSIDSYDYLSGFAKIGCIRGGFRAFAQTNQSGEYQLMNNYTSSHSAMTSRQSAPEFRSATHERSLNEKIWSETNVAS
jgi:hypothetical protein